MCLALLSRSRLIQGTDKIFDRLLRMHRIVGIPLMSICCTYILAASVNAYH
jgi:hypothetical protein